MTAYVRPTIKAPVFRDPNGQVIDYGNRWSGEPPEDTYSVDTHPERFAPLHTVADALLSYLTSNFDVAVIEDMSVTHEFVHGRDDIIRAVRVTPALPSAAAVTLSTAPTRRCFCAWVGWPRATSRTVDATRAMSHGKRLPTGSRNSSSPSWTAGSGSM